mmetsp:Transcript_43600/g.123397  ORF Transcript_43600/g.123397 Transcript_43600/m.123397 type:complete len:261 (+) Transcript_43600:27-809(+)
MSASSMSQSSGACASALPLPGVSVGVPALAPAGDPTAAGAVLAAVSRDSALWSCASRACAAPDWLPFCRLHASQSRAVTSFSALSSRRSADSVRRSFFSSAWASSIARWRSWTPLPASASSRLADTTASCSCRLRSPGRTTRSFRRSSWTSGSSSRDLGIGSFRRCLPASASRYAWTWAHSISFSPSRSRSLVALASLSLASSSWPFRARLSSCAATACSASSSPTSRSCALTASSSPRSSSRSSPRASADRPSSQRTSS